MYQSSTRKVSPHKVAGNRTGQFVRSFVEHPASVDETYFEHFCFALKFSSRLLGASFAAMIHALIPALFETTASRTVNSIK